MKAAHNRGRARISSQKKVASGYREVRLDYVGGDAPGQLPPPGSFFTLLPLSHPLQTMRRPFAYSSADKTGFSFIYQIRGDATADLAAAPEGSLIDWIGPLGTPFPEPATGRRPVLVAGGIGVGPIYFLANHLAGRDSGGEIPSAGPGDASPGAGTGSPTGEQASPAPVAGTPIGERHSPAPLVILGARTADLVPALDWPEGVELRICTDDGSAGIAGNALAALDEKDADGAEFYSCGPIPMMAGIHRLAVEAVAPCWTSMEEMMACGVGACQGCAVRLAEPGPDGGPAYKRACVEGPVFDSRELAW